MAPPGAYRFKERFSRISLWPRASTNMTPYLARTNDLPLQPTQNVAHSVQDHTVKSPGVFSEHASPVDVERVPHLSIQSLGGGLTSPYPVDFDDWAKSPTAERPRTPPPRADAQLPPVRVSPRRPPPPPLDLEKTLRAFPGKAAPVAAEPAPADAAFDEPEPAPTPARFQPPPRLDSISSAREIEMGHRYPVFERPTTFVRDPFERASMEDVALTPVRQPQRQFQPDAGVKGILRDAGRRGLERVTNVLPDGRPPRVVRLVTPLSATRARSPTSPRRSPGFVGQKEASIGDRYDFDKPKSRLRALRERISKNWWFLVLFIVVLIVVMVLCFRFLRAEDDGHTETDNKVEVPTAEPTIAPTGLQDCLSLYANADPTKATNYPCDKCVPFLSAVPSDFVSRTKNNTGVGAALQFCALMDVFENVGVKEQLYAAGWGVGAAPCNGTWRGVKCDKAGRVTDLTFQYPLVPRVVPSSLSDVVSLQTLQIKGNSTTPGGSLPTTIAKLQNLTYLDVEYTAMTNLSLFNFTTLANLQNLALVGNPSLGTILPDLSKNSKLSSIVITDQNLTVVSPGRLPTSVTYVDLSRNALTGYLASFTPLENLQTLYLQHNNLTTAPAGLPGTLTTLSLADNARLAGRMPASLCDSQALAHCDLRDTKLAGPAGELACSICQFGTTGALISLQH